jgi:hypothetical protein
LGRHSHKIRNAFTLVCKVLPTNDVNRNENTAANNGQSQKDIPTHLGEANEDGCIKANLFDEQLLFGSGNDCKP